MACESTQHIVYDQPYELKTKVGAEVDSKGQIKPSAEITISRKLESGADLTATIHADIQRGIEETMIAIKEIMQKGGMK